MKSIYALVAAALYAMTSLNAFASLSHFEVLENKYAHNTNSSITKENLEGYYLGRCYSADNETPVGMILSTRRIDSTQGDDTDQGPLFPAGTKTSIWEMVFAIEGGISSDGTPVAPASANDKATADELNKNLWSSIPNGYSPVLSIENGIAKANLPSGEPGGFVVYNVKLGNDKLFYGHFIPHDDVEKEQYCYFFRKLQ